MVALLCAMASLPLEPTSSDAAQEFPSIQLGIGPTE
jgi:hypothetical protein